MSEGLKFFIHAAGDVTVGDGSHEATVEIPFASNDKEYVQFVKECLVNCFSKIFDAKATVQHYHDAEKEWYNENI